MNDSENIAMSLFTIILQFNYKTQKKNSYACMIRAANV